MLQRNLMTIYVIQQNIVILGRIEVIPQKYILQQKCHNIKYKRKGLNFLTFLKQKCIILQMIF